MKINLTILAIFFVSHLSFANDSLQISILTCSPGQELYAIFGHSSIRVVDKEKGTDEVYNFGIFDFDTPNFALKFLRGDLKYKLGIQQIGYFINSYSSDGRLVTEQVLDLTEEQEKAIVSELKRLYQPENRYYYYLFQKKNCSTELRDLLADVGVGFSDEKLEASSRMLINTYLTEKPWLKLGVNMIMGKATDQKLTRSQSVFLPDYLKKEVDSASSMGTKLVAFEQNLNAIPTESKTNLSKVFSPLLIFSLLMLICFFWLPKPTKILFCFLIGLVGLFIAALWLFSGHPELRSNLNIFWCNPLYLLYIPLMIKNKTSRTLPLILLATLTCSVLIWIFRLQVFEISVAPVFVILGLINFKELKRSMVTKPKVSAIPGQSYSS